MLRGNLRGPDLIYRCAYLPCGCVCVYRFRLESEFFVASGEGASNQRSGEGFFVVTRTVSVFLWQGLGRIALKSVQTLTVLFNRDPIASREADEGINWLYAKYMS